MHQVFVALEQGVSPASMVVRWPLETPLCYGFKQPSCRRGRSVHVDYSAEVPADSRAACFQIRNNVQMSDKQRSSNCVAQSSMKLCEAIVAVERDFEAALGWHVKEGE